MRVNYFRKPQGVKRIPDTQKLEYIFEVADLQESSKALIFVLLFLGIGVFLRMLCNALKRRFLYYTLLLLSGFLIGVFVYYNEHLDWFNFKALAKINPNNYLLIFLPVMLFHTAFSMDYHGFGYSTLQVLFISILGFPLQAMVLAVIFSPAIGLLEDWSWEVAITFSIICYIIESDIVLYELNKTQERVKHVQLLLQGEQLATLAIATLCFRVNFEHYYGSTEILTFIVLTIFWHILAICFGVVFGYILSYIFIKLSNDIPVAVTLTMFGAFFSFYMGHVHIFQAGVVCTIVTGVMLSPTKLRTTSDVETQLTNYWDWLSFVFNTIAFVIPGITVGLGPEFIGIKLIFHVLIVYIFCCCTRLLLLISTRPLLLKMGHHLTKKNIAIVVIGPYRAAPALIVAMLYRRYSPQDGQQILTYTVALCLLSSLINGFLVPTLLKILGMYDLTHARALNMKNAITNVRGSRIKAILSLKMDRACSDANWLVVEKSTRLDNSELKSLQKKFATDKPKRSDDSEAPKIFLDQDEEDVAVSKKELVDIEFDAKRRILKAQLVSLWRQYETGTVSKSSMRVLSTLLQNAMEKEDPRLDVNELELHWSPSKYNNNIKIFLEFILRSLPQKYEYLFLPRVRATFLIITNSQAYRMVSTFLTVLDTFFLMNLALHKYWMDDIFMPAKLLQALDFFFYGLFLMEFVMLIFSLGYDQYFRRPFHKIDFTCNVLVRTCQVLMVTSLFIKTGSVVATKPKDLFVLNFVKFFLILRLNRLYTVTEVIVWRILRLLDDRLDNTLVQYYEIGKAFLIANDRTLKHLRYIIQDKAIYIKLRKLLEDDRRKVAKSIGLMQKERPNVGVTTKTRHAVIQVLNEMSDCINDIFDEGLLDDIEKRYLKVSLEQARRVLRSVKVIAPGSPEYILRDVPWLLEETQTADFLLEHAKLINYSYQDTLIEADSEPSGLFVVVSGLVKWVYKPSRVTIENCKRLGALPNCDFLSSLKFEETQEDYIVGGNVIGEIGAATGRRFDMTVICESEVQVYFIPRLCIYKALFEMENCTNVYNKMWKSIGIRVALMLLQYVSNFQGWLREKTLLYLEKSFVPILSDVDELFINEMVTDIILVEGRIMDGNSRSVYYAPFYIPRTTNKLILPGTPGWSVDPVYTTRLLIVPSKHAEEADIMGPGGIIKDAREMGKQLHTTGSSLLLPQIRKPRSF